MKGAAPGGDRPIPHRMGGASRLDHVTLVVSMIPSGCRCIPSLNHSSPATLQVCQDCRDRADLSLTPLAEEAFLRGSQP